jgi:hypothetical protein
MSPEDSPPTLLSDAGVENVNARVDELVDSGALRRVLAMTEIAFSNSMIEAWWRTLKHLERDEPPEGGDTVERVEVEPLGSRSQKLVDPHIRVDNVLVILSCL